MPRLDRPTFRRAVLLGAACLLASLSCGREVTGPPGMSIMRGFTFDARFDTPGLAHGVAGTIVGFTEVRVVLVNAAGDTVVKRVVPFPSGADSVQFGVDVPVSSSAPSSGEVMSLALAFIDAQGDTVFRGGPIPVTVVPSLPGQAPPPPPQVPVTYTGTGAAATVVEIAPAVTTILSGDPFAFSAVARDAQGQPIANTPIAWRSVDTTLARITAPGAGAGTTRPGRGPVAIIAQLLTGPADTVLIDLQPRAQAMQVVSGNNQSGTFNTALSLPLVVRVGATDGQGMAGVSVGFAVTSGGGSVSVASVLTDASGLAQVTWTTGNGLGVQTVTATAAGLVGSPQTFTAQLPAVELLHHYPMNGTIADAVGGADGSLFGGATLVEGALSLDGATGYAEFAGPLVPTNGSYSVSLFVRNRSSLAALTEYLSQGTLGDAFYIGHSAEGGIRVGDQWATTGLAAPTIDGLYHHFVVTVDSAANSSRLYVDGTLRATLPQRLTGSATGTATRLGRQYGSLLEHLDGEIDEVRIFRGALDAAAVTTLHAAGATTPGRLVFGVQPTNVVVGTPMAPAVLVRAEDALGRLKSEFNGQVTVELAANPRGATLGGTLTVSAVAGIATFTGLTVDQVASGYTLRAASPGVAPVVSTPFNVHAGAATRLEFSVPPEGASPGVALTPVVVSAVDALGNAATGFSGAVTLALGTNPTGAVLGGTLTTNAVAGVATFTNVTVDRVGTGFTFTAAATGITGATSAPFNIVSAFLLNAWIAPGDGVWSAAGNWSLGRVPNATDSVVIGGTANYTVTLDVPFSGASLVIGGATGQQTLQVGAQVLTIAGDLHTNPTGRLLTDGGTVNGTGSFANAGQLLLRGATLALPLTNTGSIDAQNTSAITGSLTAAPGSLLRLVGQGLGGGSLLTVASGFTNRGALQMVSFDGGYDNVLTVTTGVLVNAPDGTIETLAGNGGLRSIDAEVDNQGTMTLGAGLRLLRDDAIHLNSGTIALVGGNLETATSSSLAEFTNTGAVDLGAGRTWVHASGRLSLGGTVTGSGTIAVDGATLDLPAVVTGGSLSFVLVNATMSGVGSLTNGATLQIRGTTIQTPVTNVGVFEALGSNAMAGALTTVAGSTLRLRGDGLYGGATLTLANGFTNTGTIEMVSFGGGYDDLLALSAGTLTNAPTGTIRPVLGNGGVRTIGASVVNQGLIELTAGQPNVLVITGALSTTGAISMDIGGTAAGSAYDQLQVTGAATLGGTLNAGLFNSFVPSAANTFAVITAGSVSGTFATVNATPPLQGTPSYTGTTVTLTAIAAGVVNSWTNAAGGNWSVASNWSQGRTPIAGDTVHITLDGTYTVDMNVVPPTLSALALGGATGNQTLTTGTNNVAVTGDLAVGALGILSTSGGSFAGTAPLTNNGLLQLAGATVVARPLVNNGALVLRNTTRIDGALMTAPTSTIQVIGSNVGSALVHIANGFVNQGTLTLTTQLSAVNASLVVDAGTLVNAPGATIVSATGVGGPRVLSAALDNQGTFIVQTSTDNGATDATHVNSGTIDLTLGTLQMYLNGTASTFTNFGTITIGTNSYIHFIGGAADLRTGLVDGRAGFVRGSNSTLQLSSASVRAGLDLGNVVVPDPYTVAAGDTLRLASGAFSAPTVTNLGTILVSGAVSIPGTLVTDAASRIAVRGSNGATTLTVPSGFTNAGALDLTTLNSAYVVTVATTGTLVNASTGVITSLVGTGGARVLATPLRNEGQITVAQDLALNLASAAHLNTGTITLTSGDLFVTQTGTAPSFTNSGTIVTGARTVTIADGTADLSAGLVSGYAGFLVTTGAPTVRFSAATVQPRVSFSATTVLPDPLVIAAGDSLRVRGGTLAPPSLTNNGFLALEGVATINTAVTTGTGSTIRVRGLSLSGTPTATFTNALTNSATFDLATENSAYNVTLAAPGLTNTSTGVINSIVGTGGARVLAAPLTNQGQITVPQDLTLNVASAAHVNSGTITLTTGDLFITQTGTTPSFTNSGTIVAAGRTVTVAGGSADFSAGLVSGYGGFFVTTGTPTVRFTTVTMQPRVTLSATTVLPDPFVIPLGDSLRVRGGTFAPPSLTNNGFLALEGAATINTAVTTGTGSTIRVRGLSLSGTPTATFTNALTNSATLELATENSAYNVTLVAPGLTNTSTGVITSIVGTGGARVLAAPLTNQGQITVPQDLTLNVASAAHLNSGTITLTSGDLFITQTGTAPSFTNAGTIVAAARTITVAGGTADFSTGLVSGYGGFFVTTGAPTVRFTTTTMQPRVTLSATTVLPDPFVIAAGDSLRIRGGTFAPPSLTNNGFLAIEGVTTINTAVTTGTGSTIRVRGLSLSGTPTATFANALTNSATLDLATENSAYNVTLAAPGLTNTSTGVINSIVGTGGARVLAAPLTNQGQITVPQDLTLNVASAAHVNSGTITLTTGDLFITQTGTAPSFTNSGTIVAAARTVTVAGGSADFSAGLVSGYGGFFVTTGAPTARFTTTTMQPRVTLSATTVLPDAFVIPLGDSLRVRGGTFAPPSLTNNGFLALEGVATINTAVTTGTGSTIRVRGLSLSGTPTATFTNALTNSATLDLATENSAYNVTLAAPSITNTSTGVINSIVGTGGARVLAAPLTNQGQITVPQDLTLNVASAAHLNSGTITLTTGDLFITQTGTAPSFTNSGTIVAAARTVTVAGGSADFSAGLVSGYGGFFVTTGAPTVRFTTTTMQPRVTLSATTVLPDPFVIPAGDSLRVRGGTFAPPSLTNNGFLALEGVATINTAVTTGSGSTIRVRGLSLSGTPTATFANALTNSATLDLATENSAYNVTLAAPGLTNTSTGVINSFVGTGGARVLAAPLTNQGQITVPQDLTLNVASAAHLNSGTITLTTGDLFITQTGTAPSFTNTGTIVAAGRTVTVAGGSADLSAGLVSGYGGFFVTTGTPTVRFTTATMQPRVTLSATTVLPDAFVIPVGDSLRVRGGTFAPPSLTNNGFLALEGVATVNTSVTTGPGSTIRVRGLSLSGTPTATFTNAFTNDATIELATENSAYNVTLSAAGLTNTSTGVITSIVGTGGGRFVTAPLANAGLITVAQDLTLNVVSAAHLNTGTISLTSGDLFITQTGTAPSFTNSGTIAAGTRTVTVSGGTADFSAGLVSGPAGFFVTTGAPTVRFTPATVQPRVTFSATTVLPDPLVIAVGDSLRVRGGTLAPPSLVNNGTLVFDGATTISPALVANAGALTILRASAGNVTATFTSSISNAGTFRMVTENSGYAITLGLGTNTLTNAAGGTLEVLQGFGGTRFITAGLLDNLGTFSLPQGLTLTSALDQRGSLTLAAAQLLSVSGMMTLYPGSTTTINGTLQKNGGCTNLGGTIGGASATATCP